jgi:hypothetical protein
MVRFLPFVHNGIMSADALVFSIPIIITANILFYHIAEATEMIFRAGLSGQGPGFIRCEKDHEPGDPFRRR